jgi:hypothetical protein
MKQDQIITVPAQLDNVQRIALIAGILGVVAAIAGAFMPGGMTQFYHSYLLAFLFCLAFALGSMVMLMFHHVAGGRWGFIARRFFEAAMMTLPLLALLFIPLLLDIPTNYHWADPSYATGDELVELKEPYLNIPFFITRAVIYWIIWIGMAFLLYKWSGDQDKAKPGDFGPARNMRRLSAIGVLIYALTITFASVDWGMSLEVHWFSAIYGVMFAVGQAVTAWAFVIVLLSVAMNAKGFPDVLRPGRVDDFGKFLFGLAVLWTYVSYAQYIIQWSGNLAEETPWYIRRTHESWYIVAQLLIVFHFAVPFFVLLSHRVKTNIKLLALVAMGLLVMRLIDMFWLIMPAFYTESFFIHWMDVVTPIGLFGIWLALFVWILKRRPLVPLNDDLHDPRMRSFEH